MDTTAYSELHDDALLAVEGPDAAAFLHAQLTSDVAGLAPAATQYTGYCSPKGRLLATALIWRIGDVFYLQLPRSIGPAIHARLTKYVLRSKVTLTDATAGHALFGVWGEGSGDIVARIVDRAPSAAHASVSAKDIAAACLPPARFVVMASAARAAEVRSALAARARAEPSAAWMRLDIEAGVPMITPTTQERYVPQMVNLEAIGGVSFSKGCYPGQEIVARAHYLGRVKERMYRVHVEAHPAPAAGDALYGVTFGAGQASGAILLAAPAATHGHDALAVIQTAALGDTLRLRAPDGPEIRLLPLPYSLSA